MKTRIIPGFTDYMVTEEGEIYRLSTGSKYPPFYNKFGQAIVKLYNDNKEPKILTLSRIYRMINPEDKRKCWFKGDYKGRITNWVTERVYDNKKQ